MNLFGSGKFIVVFTLLSLHLISCSNKIIPDKPRLSKTNFQLDSLPFSEINIPIQINLKPFYQLAEKNIDSVFTSTNWPEDWVTIDCSNRYKYHFKRSPLIINGSGQSINMGFTGYYKIIGSTRVCLSNVVVSPWTPPCRCGFEEGERKVKINFTNSVFVYRDYKVRIKINRQEPEPQDKCTVCFFGADITNQVMTGLKTELDLAKKAIEDSFGVVDLKTQIQHFWNKLGSSFDLSGLGWLQINPQRIRLNNYFFKNDSLNLLLGMTAKPVIQFDKPAELKTLVPELESSTPTPGFNIFLDAVLNYDSLSKIMNTQLKGQQFDFEKGPIKKTVIINDCLIYGSDNEKLIIKIFYSGSNSGVAYFTGKPFYNEMEKIIEVRDIDFDVKTRNFLLRNADWMFNRRIINEIASRSKFDLSKYIDTAMTLINNHLNKEWIEGINSSGLVKGLKITGIYPLEEYLIIRSNASGTLTIKADAIDLGF